MAPGLLCVLHEVADMTWQDDIPSFRSTADRGLVRDDSPGSRSAANVRWILTSICAVLILAHPASAGILAPLLMLAVFLGERRQKLEASAIRCVKRPRDVQARIVYH